MPELPELQHVARVLSEQLADRPITAIDLPKPIVVRLPRPDFEAGLLGARFQTVQRRGKFLLFHTDRETTLAVNPMLNGRFQWTAPPHGTTKPHARTCLTLHFDRPDPLGLRYIDERYLGKIYLVPADALDRVPVLNEHGHDALDPTLDQDAFLQRLKRYRGQVKNTLTNHKFIAGIGNAYADEILFTAGIHPLAKISTLPADRRSQLYQALHETLNWAIPLAAEAIGLQIDRKPRHFLRVHRQGGQPCPRCAAPISEIAPNRRITSFCRACQPL